MKEKLHSNLIGRLSEFTDGFLSAQDGVLDKNTIESIADWVSNEVRYDG